MVDREPSSETIPVREPVPTLQTIRLGTRGSTLARWQSDWVADRLRQQYPWLAVEIVEIKTEGDRDRNSPLAAIGGAGVFTKEIQRALVEGTIDVAVHSLKDLPTDGPPGLMIVAVPAREDPADALIAPVHKNLKALPLKARVGTGSIRRRAMLLNARPDLEIVPIRGNVETRLNKAKSGELDAVVLAEAGLRRLGLDDQVTERLEAPDFLPAVGQGALGIESRRDDASILSILATLDDAPTRRAVTAERRLLAELEGGCMIPLCCLARDMPNGLLGMEAAVYSPDGEEKVFVYDLATPEHPDDLGRRVATLLRERGAERLLRPS